MSQIPTKRVTLKATGASYTINAEDFDPAKHTELGVGRPSIAPRAPEPAPPPAAPPAAPDAFDETPGSIATVNLEIARDLIEQAESRAALDELERAEKASVKNRGGRKGVLNAIKDRRAALLKK